MTDLPTKEPGEKCNARKTDGSGYCRHRAGWGTDHVGMGRCKYHGGNTPNQEKRILDDLDEAAEHGAVAFRLALKRMRRAVENGEDVDWSHLDRLARTAFDRTGHGPSEKRELTGEGGAAIEFNFTDPDDGE